MQLRLRPGRRAHDAIAEARYLAARCAATTPECLRAVLSPVLANLALSVLDEHIAQIPGGLAACGLFVPKPSHDVSCQDYGRSDLARTVSQRPQGSAVRDGDSYSLGYSAQAGQTARIANDARLYEAPTLAEFIQLVAAPLN